MPVTIAVIADPHLPRLAGTAQWAALEWALGEPELRRADLVVVAGDVTACGSAEPARLFREQIESTGLPYLITPGNSDRRSPDEWLELAEALRTDHAASIRGCLVLTADTSDGTLPQGERAALVLAASSRKVPGLALVTHFPPGMLDEDSRQFLEQWASRHTLTLLIAGHRHRDIRAHLGLTRDGRPPCRSGYGGHSGGRSSRAPRNVHPPYQTRGSGGSQPPAERETASRDVAALHVLRGLDPDKAIGGPPCVTLLHRDGKTWRRHDVSFTAATPEGWPDAERAEFLDLLGISCPGDGLPGLATAASLCAPCAELRETAAATPRGALQRHIADWRRAGGRHLSWHMPTLCWDAEAGEVTWREPWLESLAAALDVGADALTVHVPKAPVGLMQRGFPAWQQLAEVTAEDLAPAVARGCVVGIENMHMNPGELDDVWRRFGYLPDECLAWVAEVQGRLGAESVGMLLDIGHARNNAPYSERFTLGVWYAAVGARCVGYHLHQVRLTPEGMANHQPLTGLYEPLISLSSFLWAWRTGQLAHAPMFLEVREPGGPAGSLEALRALLRAPAR